MFKKKSYAEIPRKTYIQYCHSDGGGISIARSTKIDAYDCGASCGDASSVSKTSLWIVEKHN